ncbi:hypothetical protein ABPG75_011580 [Micractinium tetrahymenae]
MANRAFTEPFEVLGLPPTASREDVKQAFRRLALKCHPDVDPSPQAAARFTQVKGAADAILKGHHPLGAAGYHPGAAASWHAYAEAAARAAPDPHDSARLLRSRHAALWFCAASLAAGFGIFYFAVVSHEWMDGYRWLTPEVAESRLKHPDARRQQLMALMMQQRADRRAAEPPAMRPQRQAAGPAD